VKVESISELRELGGDEKHYKNHVNLHFSVHVRQSVVWIYSLVEKTKPIFDIVKLA